MSMSVSPRSRTVTLCLSLLIFLGLGGIHRLYTGRIFTFILQLVTAGGFFIWQLIDMIRILLGTFEDAQGRDISEW